MRGQQPAPTESKQVEIKLKKEIGLSQFFSLAFGSIIGVGWITVLGFWLATAGSAGAVMAFALGGIVILMIGLCYSEMATAIPVAGGEVAYAYGVFGLRASFAVGWLLVLGYTGVTIFETVSVGWLVEALFPVLRGPVLYSVAGSEVTCGGLVAGWIGIVLIAWFNIRGAKQAAVFQQVLTFSLLTVCLLFGAFAILHGDLANLEPRFIANAKGEIWPGILAVLVTAPFWFSGFDIIPQAMGEKASSASMKLVPIVLALAVGVAAVFYILIILAAAISLPRNVLLAADLPAADAITAAFNSSLGGKLVLLAGLLGLVSSWNAFVFGASRVLFAMGRAAIAFPQFGEVHPERRTPVKALLFISALSFLGGMFGRSAILPIVDTGALAFSLVYVIVCCIAIQHHRTGASRRRNWTMPGGAPARYISTLLALGVAVYAILAPYWNRETFIPVEWTIFGLWLSLGLVFYTLGRSSRRRYPSSRRQELLLTDMEP